MDPKTKAEFDKLQSKQCNKTCIDCGGFNPQWASVNNGCFMCIKCAGNHRSMGVHITFVRSVTMDGWSKLQLQRMKCGGNDKLKAFWNEQKFPKSLTPKQRLDNNAMDKYREVLLAKAKGDTVSKIPFIGYQSREIRKSNHLSPSNGNANGYASSSNQQSSANSSRSNSANSSRSKMTGFGNTDYDPHSNNNGGDDGWSEFGNWASSFASKTTAVASDLASNAKVAAVSIGSKASEKAATMKSKLGDEEYQANLKKNAAETWTKTTSTLSSWWSTAATSVSNVLNEDGTQNVTLYNREQQHSESRPKKKMAALSSDQYFGQNTKTQNTVTESKPNEMDILGMNGNGNTKKKKKNIDQIEAPFKAKKKKKSLDDDFDDDWGFGDDGDEEEERKETKSKKQKDEKQGIDSLLDFDADHRANGTKIEKDGNSSDDLADFMNELNLEDAKGGKAKSAKTAASKKDSDFLSNDQSKKGVDDDEDDWGWD